MLVDKAGELIADVMMANRSLSAIANASAILDTSNYTFHAITYGKDAAGYKNHAHTILSPSGNGIIKVVSYEAITVSSYHTSATASALELYYKLKPQYPHPMDTRLEASSTLPNYSTQVSDVGHNLNSRISPTLSSLSNLIGCYPASGAGTTYWMVSSSSNPSASVIISGTLSSLYNTNLLMDSLGFLTFASGSLKDHNDLLGTGDYSKGVLRTNKVSFPDKISLSWQLGPGDAGSLLLFGGIYQIGLWALDLKQMLKDGYYPPYNFSALNNTRKYRLFSKKTFSKDLLYLNDYSGSSAFKEYFDNSGSSKKTITFSWDIKFS